MPTAKVNGAEIYYEESGSGPPIILSAGGLQGTLAGYGPVVGELSREHRVISYDRRFGGRSFGAAISFGCAVRYPGRVRAIFPSNIAGGVICDSYLAMKLFKSADMALNQGIKAVVEAFDADDRFSPFTPERAQYDLKYRKTLEDMEPQDFAQVMRDTIYALFEGPYLTLGMNEKTLMGIHIPTMIMPGNNDIHPRSVAQQVHRLIPNCRWAEVAPHSEAPGKYARRVLEFLAQVETNT